MRTLLTEFYNYGTTAIAFGGGEPFTVDWFKDLLNHLKQSTKLEISVTTNGTLLTKEICQFLSENNIDIRLSLNKLSEVGQREEGLQLLHENHVTFGFNLILNRDGLEVFKKEYERLITLYHPNDILLLEYQELGRGRGQSLSNHEIRGILEEIRKHNWVRRINISSSLHNIFDDIKWARAQFPPNLTQSTGFYAAIDSKRNLKHNSFCRCQIKLEEPLESANISKLWQDLLSRPCLSVL